MSLVTNIARAAAAIARPQALAGLELLASAVVLLDAQGQITYANAAAENLLESSLKALTRQKLTAQFLNPEELDNICGQAREHKFADLRQDLTLERAGREPLHVHSIVSALDEPPGGLLIELRENQQHIKLEREERILDQSQVNKELIRNLAHEIKNPRRGAAAGDGAAAAAPGPAARIHAGHHQGGRPAADAGRPPAGAAPPAAHRRRRQHPRGVRARAQPDPGGVSGRADHLARLRRVDSRVSRRQGAADTDRAQHRAQRRAGAVEPHYRGRRAAHFQDAGGASGDAGQGPLRAGIRLAYHRQWTGHIAPDPRPYFLSPVVGTGRRQRPGPDLGANLRATAHGRHRMREPAWIYGLQDFAAIAISAGRLACGLVP